MLVRTEFTSSIIHHSCSKADYNEKEKDEKLLHRDIIEEMEDKFNIEWGMQTILNPFTHISSAILIS